MVIDLTGPEETDWLAHGRQDSNSARTGHSETDEDGDDDKDDPTDFYENAT